MIYQVEASRLKIKNIQQVKLNGKDMTIFDVYVKHFDSFGNESWVFSGQESLKGCIKRESTIIKKLTN